MVDDLFPGNEDVIFQVYLLNMTLKMVLDRREMNKTEFSRKVFPTSEGDALATMNQCRRLKEDGEPERRMSLREAMRAAKLANIPFPSLCWDVENRVRAKDPPSAP